MNPGDLVWYNCAGSRNTALVLEVAYSQHPQYDVTLGGRREGVALPMLPFKKGTVMALLQWNPNHTNVRPAMYDDRGMQYVGDRSKIPQVAWSRVYTSTGISMFKVIS